jgi:hypothetical protein
VIDTNPEFMRERRYLALESGFLQRECLKKARVCGSAVGGFDLRGSLEATRAGSKKFEKGGKTFGL